MSEPRGFGRMNPQSTRSRAPMPHELADMLDWPKNGDPVNVRIIGDVVGYGIHKVKVTKRDGSETTINKPCLAYDAETDSVDSTKPCPYCKLPTGQYEIQYNSHLYFANVIVRELQENTPRKMPQMSVKEKKTGIKELDSSSWTPVRVMRIPSTLAQRLKKLGERNLVIDPKTKAKKAFDVNHPKYGFDLEVSFDKNATPANMYSADKTESPTGEKRSPLTEEELAYLVYDLTKLYTIEDMAEAKKEAKSLNDRWYGTDADEDDEDEKPRGKKAKPSRSSKPSRSRDDDDDMDDDDMDDDEDYDLDTPKRGAKAKPSRKPSRSRDDDDGDEDEDLDDDFDEDEEDEPRGRKVKPKAKPARKSSRASDADEDEDDDFDADGDDEDEQPRGKKTKPAAKSSRKPSRRDEDEDDDDMDDDFDADEDDEDEQPRGRAASRSSKKAPTKKSSRRDADDEDDMDDDIPF